MTIADIRPLYLDLGRWRQEEAVHTAVARVAAGAMHADPRARQRAAVRNAHAALRPIARPVAGVMDWLRRKPRPRSRS